MNAEGGKGRAGGIKKGQSRNLLHRRVRGGTRARKPCKRGHARVKWYKGEMKKKGPEGKKTR